LKDLTESLREAAKIARALNQPDLYKTCMSLAERTEALADEYSAPEPASLELLGKLSSAFSMAKQQSAAA